MKRVIDKFEVRSNSERCEVMVKSERKLKVTMNGKMQKKKKIIMKKTTKVLPVNVIEFNY